MNKLFLSFTVISDVYRSHIYQIKLEKLERPRSEIPPAA